MHNSQNGTAMATDRSSWYPGGYAPGTPPYKTLLMDTCVGCHSRQSAVTYNLDGCKVPVVYTRGGIDFDDCLAGGNFYWVAHAAVNPDAKGHNVLGIAGQDGSLSKAPGYPTDFAICATNSCHQSLAVEQTTESDFGSGCQGCHLRPAHHADDSSVVVGSEPADPDGFYRFLSGHKSGRTPPKPDPPGSLPLGVSGIEDDDWQATKDKDDHNEYLGWEGELEWEASLTNLGHTMTGFCCGCHGEFHKEHPEDGNEWIRHPSDAGIPATGEYQYAFGSAGGGATGIYDPLVPVARATLTSVTATVTIGGTSPDMVMCLSCHVPHGSENDDLLRWDYNGGCEAGGTGDCGCFVCHTQKGTYQSSP